MDLIANNESAYRDEVQNLAVWCSPINLTLNNKKIKEIVVGFRQERGELNSAVFINGEAVESVWCKA